jgi:hypothetical protein
MDQGVGEGFSGSALLMLSLSMWANLIPRRRPLYVLDAIQRQRGTWGLANRGGGMDQGVGEGTCCPGTGDGAFEFRIGSLSMWANLIPRRRPLYVLDAIQRQRVQWKVSLFVGGGYGGTPYTPYGDGGTCTWGLANRGGGMDQGVSMWANLIPHRRPLYVLDAIQRQRVQWKVSLFEIGYGGTPYTPYGDGGTCTWGLANRGGGMDQGVGEGTCCPGIFGLRATHVVFVYVGEPDSAPSSALCPRCYPAATGTFH